MTLDSFNTEINNLRDAAERQRRLLRLDKEAARANPNLSEAGRREVLANTLAEVKAEVARLGKKEETAIANKLESLHRSLHTRLGTSSSDILAMRDAEERADALDDPNKALKAIERARRSDDKSLAYAVIRRASDMGWGQVIDSATESYPDAAQAIRDIDKVTRFRDDITQTIGRGMAYTVAE